MSLQFKQFHEPDVLEASLSQIQEFVEEFGRKVPCGYTLRKALTDQSAPGSLEYATGF